MTVQVQKEESKTYDNGSLIIPELLSPAGDWDSLVAAIENGADAIYLGGKKFSARRGAENFSKEEIDKAVNYAHLQGVRIYVTVNILISDFELKELTDYIIDLYNIGVDALIIQDLGAYKIFQEIVPDLPLHASTQMNIQNLYTLHLLRRMGFKRANLSRELTLEEMSMLAQASPIELEVFIHGSLCYCYSGLCLFSSMIHGRSGNRGLCVQACRLPYKIIDKKGQHFEMPGNYPLSMKDLSTVKIIKDICQLPVSALKIEGRMKSPEYVALATSAYRQILDGLNNLDEDTNGLYKDLEWKLMEIFNRKFSEGYFKYNKKSNIVSFVRPNHRGVYIGRIIKCDLSEERSWLKLKTKLQIGDVIEVWIKEGGRVRLTVKELWVNGISKESAEPGEEVDVEARWKVNPGDRIFRIENKKLLSELRETYKRVGIKRKIKIKVKAVLKIGNKVLLIFQSEDGYTVENKSRLEVQKATKKSLTKKEVKANLCRLGTSAYKVSNWELELDEGAWFPLSELNDLRRRTVELLNQKRLVKYKRENKAMLKTKEFDNLFFKQIFKDKVKKMELCLLVDKMNHLKLGFNLSLDWIYFNLASQYLWSKETGEAIKEIKESKNSKKLGLVLPAVVKEQDFFSIQMFFEDYIDYFDGLVIGNLGWFEFLSNYEKDIIVDTFLNTNNHLTGLIYQEKGIRKIIISPELTLAQIKKICSFTQTPIEVIAHGYIEIMQTEQNLLENLHSGVTEDLSKTHFLEDIKEYRFPFIIDVFRRTHIFNSKPLSLLKYIPLLWEAGVSSLKLNLTNFKTEIIKDIVGIYREACNEVVQGNRDLSEVVLEAQKMSESFSENTTGHLFRGVE